MARLEELRREFREEVAFLYVYIKEAHPADEWQMDSNVEEELIFDQPTTFEERMNVAQAFVAKMEIEGPVVVDEIDNIANACFAAWPERLYVIDTDGRITYKGGMGPFDFDTDELEVFLETSFRS